MSYMKEYKRNYMREYMRRRRAQNPNTTRDFRVNECEFKREKTFITELKDRIEKEGYINGTKC